MIDIKSVLKETFDITQAQKTTVTVQIFIDETTSPEFQVFVRSGFNSDSVNSRVLVSYFPSQDTVLIDNTDLVVIAAGAGEQVGYLAQTVRNSDVAALVVAEHGQQTLVIAQQNGYPIPEDDVISPKIGQPFNEEIKGELADRIGTWIVKAHPQKRLAFSMAYPYVRHPLAKEAIRATALQNAGVGLVTFVPGADLPVMTINQIKMVLQISAAYGEPLTTDRIREIIPVIAGGFFCRNVARAVTGVVPVLGWAVKAGIGYSGTVAMGEAALAYYENGANMTGLAGLLSKTGETALDTATKIRNHRAYKAVSTTAGPQAKKIAGKVFDAAGPIVSSGVKTVIKSLSPFGKKPKGNLAAEQEA